MSELNVDFPPRTKSTTSSSWEKIGLLFRPENESESMGSYCSMPMVHRKESTLYRLFFSSRDAEQHSAVHFLEFDINTPLEINEIQTKPVFSKGNFGHFDDNGVYSGSIIEKDEKLYMFYSGRSNGVEDLYYMNIGLAVSEDGGSSFSRVQQSPVLTRSEFDPWLVTAPYAFKSGEKWLMVYTSGTEIFNDRTSRYDLKIASSEDFFHWKQTGKTAIPLQEHEANLSTATVLELNGTFHLWFSVKPKTGVYTIGYARSINGLDWQRDDDRLGLTTSPAGFDSEALSYPNVFLHETHLYMVYSGNQNGKGGCGLARLSIEDL
tara:strand:+ start:438 stop:1400 length:963 start_codon:yes stop_codon:yes gene_type:complete